MSRAKRTSPEIRREQILEAAIKLSIKFGYTKITRDKIAEATKTASSLIAKYYPRMQDVKNAVMEAAIKREVVEIIAQGLTLNDPRALKINKSIKRKVMSYIANI